MPLNLLRVYQKPSNTILHLGVMLLSFVLFGAFEYFYNNARTNFFHFHKPAETALLFITLLLVATLVVLHKVVIERNYALSSKEKAGSFIAFMSALGIGCVSCGTALAVPIASFLGFSGLFLSLPFEGREVQILGIAFLLTACLLTLKKLQQPALCKIDN